MNAVERVEKYLDVRTRRGDDDKITAARVVASERAGIVNYEVRDLLASDLHAVLDELRQYRAAVAEVMSMPEETYRAAAGYDEGVKNGLNDALATVRSVLANGIEGLTA